LANAATCSSVCLLSFGRAIHSRMSFRRIRGLPSSRFLGPSYLGQQGARPRATYGGRQVCRASNSAASPWGTSFLPHTRPVVIGISRKVVGVARFERATPSSRTAQRSAYRLRGR
jgi:hypothetical protein